MRKFDLTTFATLTLLALVTAATATGCRGRDRRPIVVQAPTTNPSGRNQNANPGTGPGAAGVDGLQGGGNGGAQGNPANPTGNIPTTTNDPSILPPVTDPANTTPTPTVPSSSGGGAQPGPTGSQLSISTTLEDGTPAVLQWDAKSFKGNDKWDVVTQ